jgi:homoserine kinase type II
MAVYTHVSAEQIAQFLTRFDVGTLLSAKGIAEGVENSNYMIEASRGRFILTLYEKRVDPADLPFFLGLMNHLADAHLPVPRALEDRAGDTLHDLAGRKACLIQFLPGLSVSEPTLAQCKAVGRALARLHMASASFGMARTNSLTLPGWARLANATRAHADAVSAGLRALIDTSLANLGQAWPSDLPRCAIHADLFPDNVLLLGDDVTGLIDFYFACTDFAAYDLAVTLAAWAFSPDGAVHHDGRAAALVEGYESVRPLSVAEQAALPLLAQGAALRFTLTRLYDWVNTPAGALVTRKDPMAFARRLQFYRAASPATVCGQA